MKRKLLFSLLMLLGFLNSYAQNEITIDVGDVSGNNIGDIVVVPVWATSAPMSTDLLSLQGTFEFSNPNGLDFLSMTSNLLTFNSSSYNEVNPGVITFSVSGVGPPIITIDQTPTPLFEIEVKILEADCTDIGLVNNPIAIQFVDTSFNVIGVDATDIGQVCIGCIPDPVMVTADGVDITDTLTYTLPCDVNTVEIASSNLDNPIYLTPTPGVTHMNGVFTVTDPTVTAFVVRVGGQDSCGEDYEEDFIINLNTLEPDTVLANGNDITTTLAYSLCETDELNIDLVNVYNAVFESPELGVTNTDGEFSLPINNTPSEFTVEITGEDNCGNPYSATVSVTVLQLLPVTLTANGDNITGQSSYDICNSVDIDAINVFNTVFESTELGITNNDGVFTVPANFMLSSFKVRITGDNSFGKPYSRSVTINILDNPHIIEVNLLGHNYVNTSGNSPGNYEDYTDDACIPFFETSTQLIQVITSELGSDISFYIDLNEDGVFNDQEEFFGSSTINAQPTEFVIPDVSIVGGKTLRIITSKDQIFDGNEIPDCGEVEDYTLCPPCVPDTAQLTANGENIANSYTIPCGTNSVDIDVTNVTDLEFFSPELAVTNNDGVFTLPQNSNLTSFDIEVTGKDSCGELYMQVISIEIEQDCNSCTLEAVASVGMCDDNGTPLDPSDDFYTITLDVFNTAAEPWTVVDSNGWTIYFGNGDENNVNLGTYLVVNQSEAFQIRYGDGCYLDIAVVAPTSCNFSCNIQAVIADMECVTEDSYLITLHVLGTNGVSWELIGYPNGQAISYSGTGNTTNIQLGPISTNDPSWLMSVSPTGVNQSSCGRFETTVFAPRCSEEGRGGKNQIRITPNPNHGEMNIQLELEKDSNATLEIFRFDGTLVRTVRNLKTTNGVLSTEYQSDLPPGLYLFKFHLEGEVITKKVIFE